MSKLTYYLSREYQELKENETHIKSVIKGIVERRKKLGIPVRQLSQRLHDGWHMTSRSVEQSIVQSLENGGHWTYAIPASGHCLDKTEEGRLTKVEVTSRRMSDYLAVLGYSEAEAMKVFEELAVTCPQVKYCRSKVNPFNNARTETKLQDSLDSMGGLGNFVG